jgi:hypothetical protein
LLRMEKGVAHHATWTMAGSVDRRARKSDRVRLLQAAGRGRVRIQVVGAYSGPKK